MGDELQELDTAYKWRIPFNEWVKIPAHHRAKMVAFLLYRGIREAYSSEYQIGKAKDKAKNKKKGSGYEAMMSGIH